MSARQFDLLKQYEPVQQRFSALAGHAANTVTGTLASGGTAHQRRLMAADATLEDSQYSRKKAEAVVRHRGHICDTANNGL